MSDLNNKKIVLVDCRFVGGGSALGRYAEELVLNLIDVSQSLVVKPILNKSNKKNIPEKLKNASPLWVDIPHYSLKEQFDFLKILKKEKPDLIHYTHFNGPLFSPKPFIVTIHDLTLHKFKEPGHSSLKRAFYIFLINFLSRRASHIIASSNYTKKDVEKFLKILPGKISVVYLGIENKFTPQPEKKIEEFRDKFDLHSPFIMYAGQWKPHKNLLRLFEAFAILKKEYHIEEKLVLVGKVDERYPAIPEKVKELGIASEVRFLGFLEDNLLPLAYSSASLYVIPSLNEGFGFPPLEAMACGTPVAASMASCLPEILDDAVVYFDPYDVKDMAVKINLALKNEKLRKVLRERGLKWVKKYNWKKTAEETLRIYENILTRNNL